MRLRYKYRTREVQMKAAVAGRFCRLDGRPPGIAV